MCGDQLSPQAETCQSSLLSSTSSSLSVPPFPIFAHQITKTFSYHLSSTSIPVLINNFRLSDSDRHMSSKMFSFSPCLLPIKSIFYTSDRISLNVLILTHLFKISFKSEGLAQTAHTEIDKSRPLLVLGTAFVIHHLLSQANLACEFLLQSSPV